MGPRHGTRRTHVSTRPRTTRLPKFSLPPQGAATHGPPAWNAPDTCQDPTTGHTAPEDFSCSSRGVHTWARDMERAAHMSAPDHGPHGSPNFLFLPKGRPHMGPRPGTRRTHVRTRPRATPLLKISLAPQGASTHGPATWNAPHTCQHPTTDHTAPQIFSSSPRGGHTWAPGLERAGHMSGPDHGPHRS